MWHPQEGLCRVDRSSAVWLLSILTSIKTMDPLRVLQWSFLFKLVVF